MSPAAGVEIDADDGVVVARLSGEVDLSNAELVKLEVTSAVPNSALGLVLDLTATEYLDSSGVQLVFELSEGLRRRQQLLRVVVPEGAPIRRVLRIVNLPESVPVRTSVTEAAAEIRNSA